MSSLRLLPRLVYRSSCSPLGSTISSPLTMVAMVIPQYRCSSDKASKWKIWKSKEDPLTVKEEEEEELSEMEVYQNQVEEMEKEARAEFIQSKRNKSRLSASDRQTLFGEPPHAGVMFEYNSQHRSKEFKGAMMSKYGVAKTGVEPGIMWPNDKELGLAREWEELYQEQTLGEQIRQTKMAIEKRKEDRIAKEKMVEENLSKMDVQVKQWRQRVGAKNKQAEAEMERREKVLAELKLEFGYSVNQEDSYMVGRIADREKVLVKEEREAKRALKKEKQSS
eukprot:GFUD01052022.1.p1 GENE.GFUD01052022.1~~GFUD01052022.1.p1  ORF type:complete len:279 (+),score=137.31 GFUD01052022.1:51-887(+)